MKKRILKSTLCAVAVAATMFGGNLVSGMNSEISSDDLLLSNVEALTAGDGYSFDFNGQHWTTNYTAPYNDIPYTSNWCPTKTSCSKTVTYSAGASYKGVSGGYSQSMTIHGHCIYCINGNGNCVNGTDCIPD